MYRHLICGTLLLFAGAVPAQDKPAAKLTEAEKKLMAKVRQLGGHAMELAQNDPRVEVSYQVTDGKITDEHLALLKEMKGLVHLNLRAQAVTDAHLVHLQPLTGLVRLHLEKTKITDQGLEHLKGLTNLEYLNLYGTEITDKGLVHLEGLKKLTNLYLWQTKVTDAGVDRLKKAIPKVDVNRGFELKPIEPKKDEKKPDPKKDEKKKDKPKDDKKDEGKKAEKKDEKKPEPKKDEKQEEKKPEPKKEAEKTPEPKKQDKPGEEKKPGPKEAASRGLQSGAGGRLLQLGLPRKEVSERARLLAILQGRAGGVLDQRTGRQLR